jgi:hypothetical protein
MPSGGKRPGAGRKPIYSPTAARARKRARDIIDRASLEGITPLEVQLRTMRMLWERAHRTPEPDLDVAQQACAIAAAVAVYVHPRLASVAARIETVANLSDPAFELRVTEVLDLLSSASDDGDDDDDLPALPAPVLNGSGGQ